MSININRVNGTITLHTKNTSYQMKVDEIGILLHTYYGKKTDDTDMSYQICTLNRGFSGNPYEIGRMDGAYSLDVLPQEYSCFGTGDYRTTALRVQNPDGSQAAELRYVNAEIVQGKNKLKGLPAVYADENQVETLIVHLKDTSSDIAVELQYSVLEELDIITRSARIINTGSKMVVLQKAASVNLDFQFGEYDWIIFQGRHAMERNLERSEIHYGMQSIGSVRGSSSHHYNPFVVLCDRNATETTGNCYALSFLYSGEFLIEAEKDPVGQTRMIGGIHPDNFAWNLLPDESFQTPEMIMAFSSDGLGMLSQILHRTIREHVCRGKWKHERRPVLINNWEATYFDFTGEKLVSIAREAAGLGIELFVLDDGWFGKRDDDNSGLGDWYPNEKKLGCTLKELGDQIVSTGMKFGIWFEPEGISEDSNLYRQHPEWAVQIPGRKPNLSRKQLILDFSRKDVQDYIIQSMSKVLSEAPISYVKWDMNRSICDKYSSGLDSEYQGEFSHRYILGLYHVLETLIQRFPDVLFEGCSGGGGRFDAGMLYYTPQIWCSDNTDAINRLKIQYGTSFGYPISTMGAHVSAIPNHQTGRRTSLYTRGCVAMAGTFGYELDVTKMTEEEKKEVRKQITLFKKYYNLIQYGNYYRLSPPEEMCTVWEFAAPEGEEALVSAVFSRIEANYVPIHVQVQGLQENRLYRVELLNTDSEIQSGAMKWLGENTLISGAALKNGGLTIPPAQKDYHAWQLHIKSVDD